MYQPADAVPLGHITRRATDPEHAPDSPNTPQPWPNDEDQNQKGDFGPSESLFSMYLDRAIEQDRRMVEGWKGDAEAMLTFTGLFSAATAALLAVSVSDIRPNPQYTSQPSIPSSTGLSNQTLPPSPPTLSVWVNGLWFLSLAITLTCALLATLLLRWARRYERVAYPRYRPQKRARIHAFYRRGVEKWRIPRAIETFTVLLHISLFVFFAGLSAFLFGLHRTIFKVVTAWMGACVILYACLSVSPVSHKDSPYSTPLSETFSFCLTGIRYLFFLKFPSFGNFIRKQLSSRDPGEVYIDDFFSHSITKTAEKYAFTLNPDIDHVALLWTFETLEEDTDFEEFFEDLLRLCDSDTGKKLELKEKYIEPNKEKLSKALIGLIDRTLLSDLVKDFVKHRRIIIFIKAMESKLTSLLDPSWILRRVLFGGWHGLLGYIEFGLSMRNWADNLDKVTVTSFYAQCVAALTISIGKRDKRWIQLAKNPPSSVPSHHHENDDSLLLDNAIFIVRITVQAYTGSEVNDWDKILYVSRWTLGAICKLDIQHTLPALQHEFCDLWNKLVITAQTDELPQRRSIVVNMLKIIRELYIALHGTTPETAFNTADDWEQILDNSELYPKCTDERHRSSTSFPALQFNAPPPPTQPVEPTPSAPRFPEPHTLTHNLDFPVVNPYVPPPRFPEPHTPSHNML